MGDYTDILITVHAKRLHMNYDNLFMFQSYPRSLKQLFRTGGKSNNEWTLHIINSPCKTVLKIVIEYGTVSVPVP